MVAPSEQSDHHADDSATTLADELAQVLADAQTKDETEKQKRLDIWAEAEEYFGNTVDRIGRLIDPDIMEVVLGVNVLGLESNASCGGHLDRGRGYPWLDFEVADDVLDKYDEFIEDLKKKNPGADVYRLPEYDNYCMNMYKNTMAKATAHIELVDKFNEGRAEQDQLLVSPDIMGEVTIKPYTALAYEEESASHPGVFLPLNPDQLAQMQTVMVDFAKFIKQGFLSGQLSSVYI